ncbi:PHD finger domain containing protein [Pyrenophora tritici-repentis]|nr:PHD finger domain containing protein [Pyrenophora tritici-repentis]
MIACDNDDCPREWFHLACVHLEKAPTGRTKWFCSDECKDTHAKAKTKGGRPGSSRQ